MAIYYFNASVISRSAGRSATASAAYRAAERIIELRTGEIHDYTKKKGVDETLILAPTNAPDWVLDRSSLWNEVERVERRKNSQLAREIKLAIPVELDRTQQIELVKEFATEQFVNKGMVADVSFHELDSHNPHAHIMLTMREINEHGFSPKKNRDWNKRELLEQQREAWAVTANLALEKAGISESIDHRTLEAQGINRIPQIHLGSAVTAMMKRGISTDKGDTWLAIKKANQRIATLEKEITALEIATQFRGIDNLALALGEFQDLENLALAIEKVNPQIQKVNRQIQEIEQSRKVKLDSEITPQNQSSLDAENPYRTKYLNTARLVRRELGTNISSERLDLEIYLRTNSEAEDRLKVIGESDFVRFLQQEQPLMAKSYLKAISHVAGTYKSLSNKNTPNLDALAKQIVNTHLVKFELQDNSISPNLTPKRRRGRSL